MDVGLAEEPIVEAGELSLPGLSADELLRAELRRVMSAEKKSMADVAREAGIGASTLPAWVSGKYQGRNETVASAVKIWLDGRQAQMRTRAALKRAPGFVMTQSAEMIFSVLEHAQHAPDFVVVGGGPGIGKTTSIAEYGRRSPNVWTVTAEPAWQTPRMLLDCLAEGLGVTEKYSAQKVSRAITLRLRASGGLLIVDEANHLSSQSIDQLRTFHDLAGVGIALVGNETVYSRLEGDGRKAQFAQLFSRIGMRLSRQRPYARDITMLLDAWGIDAAPERKLLQALGSRPGALRGMTKVLKLAFTQASASGRDMVCMADIERACAQLGETSILETKAI